jgi:Integrase core domain
MPETATHSASSIRIVKAPVRAPQANAIAERFVRTVRAECLDWLLILNRRHLERVLRIFIDYYNTHRPHRALKLHHRNMRSHRRHPRPARSVDATASAASSTSATETPPDTRHDDWRPSGVRCACPDDLVGPDTFPPSRSSALPTWPGPEGPYSPNRRVLCRFLPTDAAPL